jgi:hypothetical protein
MFLTLSVVGCLFRLLCFRGRVLSLLVGGARDVGLFDFNEPVHRDTTMKVTNEMQLYRLIYYS